MPDYNIILPSKPKIVVEKDTTGVYEVEGLYPGYGHTLGNSLRRIILSSMPGVAVTSVSIDGVDHEFSSLNGVKEDVITILLNLRRVNFVMHTDEAQEVTLTAKGANVITAADLKTPGQVEIVNPDQHILEITDKGTDVSIRMTLEKGLGYIPKEALRKEKVEIGTIALDAVFTPIRRVSYEVENMRVGDRTDYNRLRISIETDGTIAPREVLEGAIHTMIQQLKAVVGFQEDDEARDDELHAEEAGESGQAGDAVTEATKTPTDDDKEIMKTRIDSIDFSTRTANALRGANIRTLGGLVRKRESELLDAEGMGDKGVREIKEKIAEYSLSLKE